LNTRVGWVVIANVADKTDGLPTAAQRMLSSRVDRSINVLGLARAVLADELLAADIPSEK
jgi:hypothetical protein